LGGAAFAVAVGVAWLDLISFEQYVWFSFASARGASGPRHAACPPRRQTNQRLSRQKARDASGSLWGRKLA
jgi:hypothetical protein